MKLMTGLLGGVVGAGIGAALWAVITYFTGYEVGWIAWGIGGLSGAGVAIGTAKTGGAAAGGLAVILALFGITTGKWWATELSMNSWLSSDDLAIAAFADDIEAEYREANRPLPPKSKNKKNEDRISSEYAASIWKEAETRWSALSEDQQEEIRNFPPAANPDFIVSYIADLIVFDEMDAGKSIEWPSGNDDEAAWRKAHYPVEIWSGAEERWNAMSPDEQREYRQQVIASQTQEYKHRMAEFRSSMGVEAFLASFSPFDLLWVLLAVGSAYRIASTASEKRLSVAEGTLT